jgi:hypothetical protein
MSSFTQAKVYKMTFGNSEHFYIGSTINTLQNRLTKHKNNFINYDYKLFNIIMDSNMDEWDIELLEMFDCDNKNILRQREQHFIDLLKPTMNTNKAYVNDGLCGNKYSIRKHNLKQATLSKISDAKLKYKTGYQAKFITCECGKKVYNIPYKMNIHLESRKHKKFLTL